MSTSLHVVSLGLHSWVCHPRFEALHCRLSRAGERETLVTYSILALVVGGVIVASGVEPSLNLFGAATFDMRRIVWGQWGKMCVGVRTWTMGTPPTCILIDREIANIQDYRSKRKHS